MSTLKVDDLQNLASEKYGRIVQVVNVQDGANATGTSTIALDNTIPQITEGDEYMTLAVTPTNASNILQIDVVSFCYNSAINNLVTALFVGVTANALATGRAVLATTNDTIPVIFTHRMTAGVDTELTFRVRTGCSNAGTTVFNGAFYGGTLASSITITEIRV